MKANWDIILAEAVKAKPNIAQFWKGENEAQAAFRTNGCVLGQCWDSTGYNLQSEGLPLRLPRAQGRRVRLEPGLHAPEEREERRAGARVRRSSSPRPRVRPLHAAAFRANPVAKGAIDLADPKVSAFYKAAFPATR